MPPTAIQIIAVLIFIIAILHTFATQLFEHQAHVRTVHAGLWHLLGEVEVVFGFWAMVLVAAMFMTDGVESAKTYVSTRNFTEPMFVFAIMVIAATRPILLPAKAAIEFLARAIPIPEGIAFFCVTLTLAPLLGSFITEPAAMTLAALILRERFFVEGVPSRLKYATLGVLFVNVSIGGTLTAYAAPPVIMVVKPWDWDTSFMMSSFGWKAAIAVIVNTIAAAILFRREIASSAKPGISGIQRFPPIALTVVHLVLLAGVVVFSHEPAIFMGIFLFFLGIVQAYERYQDNLLLREGLLVGFFLAGLVVIGGQQQWWLQPLLVSMKSEAAFYLALGLSPLTDNAALTYLASLVDGLSDDFKYYLVAGAVTGGGLTIIGNAPNPAGIALLRRGFADEAVHPLGLLLGALPPTIVAALAFRLL